ncbi:unnamed protein product [Ilex paraguariensis]|uniref:Uncharacterized protein n=1 Tax=Ilex paraguariensis TaxID=185542 RepID=A0ABC8QWD2_9AQUA
MESFPQKSVEVEKRDSSSGDLQNIELSDDDFQNAVLNRSSFSNQKSRIQQRITCSNKPAYLAFLAEEFQLSRQKTKSPESDPEEKKNRAVSYIDVVNEKRCEYERYCHRLLGWPKESATALRSL